MEQFLLAGLFSGLVLAGVLLPYTVLRGRALVAFFQGLDANMVGMSSRVLFLLLIAGFIMAALLFGLLAGLIYKWIGSPLTFALMGLGAAVLLSLLALVSRTPLAADKIAWNFVVGLVLGLLVPLL
jgi:hypothetical protein